VAAALASTVAVERRTAAACLEIELRALVTSRRGTGAEVGLKTILRLRRDVVGNATKRE